MANSVDEINDYLISHPLMSDKKLARRLKIDRAEITKIRTFLTRPKNTEDKNNPPPFLKKLLWREKINRIKNRLASSRALNLIFTGRLYFFNLFLLALFLRLLYLYFLKKEPLLSTPMIDAEYYLDWADRILKEGLIGTKVYFTEPLYAYLMAFFLKLTHSRTITQDFVIALQIICQSFLPILVYKLADKTFNRQVAIVSSLLSAIYGPFIFYDHLLLKTSFETFFLTLLVYLLIKITQSKKPLHFVLVGLFIGLIASLKGNATILVPAFSLLVFLFLMENLKRKLLLIVLFWSGFLLAISPLTIHNYLAAKDFVLTNYSVGMVLHGGNWWDYDGGILPPPFIRPVPQYEEIDSYKMAEAYEGRKLKASEVSAFWTKKAVQEITSDPPHFIKLVRKKFLLLVNRTELSDNYDYAFYTKKIPLLRFLPNFWPVISFALTGILILLFSQKLRLPTLSQNLSAPESAMQKDSALQNNHILSFLSLPQKLLLGTLFAYCLLIVIGAVNSRYRVPLIPLFIILASFTIVNLYNLIRLKSRIKYLFLLFTAFCFFLLTSIHLDNFDFMTDANFYNNIGAYYNSQKDEEKAEKYFLKALEIKNDYPWGYGNLFDLYLKHGEFALAKNNLTKQLELRPDDLGVYYKLKLYKTLNGKPLDFIENRFKIEEKKALREGQQLYDPEFFEFQHSFKKGDYQQAQKFLEESARKYNKPENTMINLATVKKLNGNVEEAKDTLLGVLQRSPDFLVAKYNLANYYIQEKNWPEVGKLLQDVYDFAPEFGSGNTLWYLAVAYINQQQYETATPLVQEYLQKYADDPTKKEQVDKFKSLLKPNN